jgi:hypothetical protein
METEAANSQMHELVHQVPPSTLAGGTKVCANAAVAEKLVAAATPCRAVRIMARVDADGNAVNTKPCFVGDVNGQNVPVMPANFEGVAIPIDDASKLYVKVGVNGEGVTYRIYA